MSRCIRAWLQTRSNEVKDFTHTKYLVLDGTFLKNRTEPVFIVLDATTRRPIFWKYGARESQRGLVPLFVQMKKQGCEPISATIDGNPAIFKSLRAVWPGIQIQRCLVHMQRQGLMWCRAYPKRRDAQMLRNLFLVIPYIQTHDEAYDLVTKWNRWDERYGRKLDRENEHGPIQSDVKRARSMLEHALPFLFLFLEDRCVPSTTNMAEGCISRLKLCLREHRGLQKTNRQDLVYWFLNTRS